MCEGKTVKLLNQTATFTHQLHILTAVYLVSSGAAIMTEIILNILTLSFLKQTQPLWSYVQMEMAGCVISFLALVRFWFLVCLNWLETSLLTRAWGFRFLEKRLGSCNISCLIIVACPLYIGYVDVGLATTVSATFALLPPKSPFPVHQPVQFPFPSH